MANNDDYLRLRRMAGEVDSDTYTNADLDIFIANASGDLNSAASLIWGEKASSYADLVNISEAGSSRSNSDLYKQAKQQEQYYSGLADASATAAAGYSTTRPIKRA